MRGRVSVYVIIVVIIMISIEFASGVNPLFQISWLAARPLRPVTAFATLHT